MIKIKLICIGKLKEKGYKDLEAEYTKRLKPYAKFELLEIPEVPYKSESQKPEVVGKEADKILNYLKPNDCVIALDELGVMRDSPAFATFLERVSSLGQAIVFVIGGSFGLDKRVLDRANHKMSLSKMTFLHNMARLILVEQLYRAFTIQNGKIYHK